MTLCETDPMPRKTREQRAREEGALMKADLASAAAHREKRDAQIRLAHEEQPDKPVRQIADQAGITPELAWKIIRPQREKKT